MLSLRLFLLWASAVKLRTRFPTVQMALTLRCTACDSRAAAQDESAVPRLAEHVAEHDEQLQEGCTELVIVQRKFADPGADCGPGGLATDPHRGAALPALC